MNPKEQSLRNIAAALAGKCHQDESGCLIWEGRVSSDCAAPIARSKATGKQKRVTRLIVEAALERPLEECEKVRQTCKKPLCVNWEHLEVFRVLPRGSNTIDL